MSRILSSRILLVAVLMLFGVGGSLYAQEQPEQPGQEGADIGNMVIVYGGLNYMLNDLPYASIGFGFDFPLSSNILFSPGIRMLNTRISEGADYTGATSVEGGEINYIDINFDLKFFLQQSWWFSVGFIYESFRDGYYIDNDGANILHVALNSTDESNKLGFRTSTGIYSSIRENIYVIPGIALRYSLPTSSDYSFSASDIVFIIDFGLGFKM
ncbi:MAG: hypothetical protein ACOC7U_04460 [Spirochaetota bacterium]